MPTTARLFEVITCPSCEDIDMHATETRYAMIHRCGVCGHSEER